MAITEASPPPAPATYDTLSRRTLVLSVAGLLLGLLLAALDQTIVGTALPRDCVRRATTRTTRTAPT